MKRIIVFLGAAVFAFGSAGFSGGAGGLKKGPAVDRIVFSSEGVDASLSALKAKKIDLYIFGIKNTAASQLDKISELKAYRAPAGSVSLLLNPAPAPPGELNPFSLPGVRRAMNSLIDRNYIADTIYGGFAIPQVSHVAKVDFDYLTVAKVLAQEDIRYDFDEAKKEIFAAMTKAGAKLANGKWTYRGRTIKLRFIVRTEDERYEIGNAIAENLRKLGFDIVVMPKDFAGAITTVYTSDPSVFEWHLYTEGWGRGSSERYDSINFNQMNMPWMGNMPGWQIPGFWQYQNNELDRIGKRIFAGDFGSKKERDELYRKGTRLALRDAVRLWIVTVYGVFPAQRDLTNVMEDVVSGPKGLFALRGAFMPGKDTLRVGNLNVTTAASAWNPVGGFEDVYSIDIWKNIFDPPVMNDPFTGDAVPFRASFAVTSNSVAKIAVPKNAVMWDAKKDRWVSVGSGLKVKSRVVFDFSKYFQSVWHHGQRITMADILYDIASTFERTYDAKKRQVEPVLAAISKEKLQLFKAFRVLDNNKLEVYLNYWHFDKGYIASYASLASVAWPWEVLAATDALVYGSDQKGQPYVAKQVAYTKTSAARYARPWLSLVYKDHANMVANVLRAYLGTRYVPRGYFTVGGKNYLQPSQATGRYLAALSWVGKHKHFVIANGPFFLNYFGSLAEQSAELLAFRDKTYPYASNFWYRQKPADIEFDSVSLSGDTIKAKVKGPGSLGVQYLVIDQRTREVVAIGIATKKDNDEFEAKLNKEELKNKNIKYLEILILAFSDKTSLVEEKVVKTKI